MSSAKHLQNADWICLNPRKEHAAKLSAQSWTKVPLSFIGWLKYERLHLCPKQLKAQSRINYY